MQPRKGLSGLVVKIVSRCNINCSYCYMYNLGDESYRLQPKIMAERVVDQLMQRSFRHCKKYGLKEFEFILHGGEPLLAGRTFIENFVRKARQRLEKQHIKVTIGIQTNGLLLDAEWCRLLNSLSLNIGISIDGPALWHDKYRKDHQQKGTHARALLGLSTAQQEQCNIGVLSVVNPASDPITLYRYFKQLNIKNLDFLWPDHHYEKMPDLYVKRCPAPDYTPFGDWWIRLFNCWFTDSGPRPRIRFLNQVILMILGIDTGFESIGQEENRYLIIETDGGIEASDYLKACGDGFTKEGLNINLHDLSEATWMPLVKMHRQSHRILSKVCRNCAIRSVCGGGHMAHRFGRGNGFKNPSIYCFDLMKLLTHIQNTLLDHLSADTIRQAGLVRMSYQEALKTITTNTDSYGGK